MKKRTKFLLLRTSVILAFAVLAGRIWYIQVVQGSYYKQQADTSKLRLEPVAALRGIIYDRYGHQLVYNAPAWKIDIVPHGLPPGRTWAIYRKLSQLLHNNPTAAQIARTVQDNMFQQYAAVDVTPNVSVSFDTAMIVKQMHLSLPGVSADPVSVRHYVQEPQFSLSHILGYTSTISPDQFRTDRQTYPRERFTRNDQAGASGLEFKLEPFLHGVNGNQEVMVDAGERPIRVMQRAHTIPGDSVYLTINWKLQQQVSQDLAAALNQLQLRQGVAILEDVRTGAIRAMVSLPSYNNDWFAGGISLKRYSALAKDPANPLYDLATAGQYPPGSTYKIITAAAALQTGAVNAGTAVDDTGAIKLCSVYDSSVCQVYHGWKPGGLGVVNVVTALAESSDIYMYTVAGGDPNYRPCPPNPCVGATRLAQFARLFGLGNRTGIEIPNEATGLVPDPLWFSHQPAGVLRHPGQLWHIGDTYNMAIGQGFNVATPLQMVNVAATIANGGTLYKPTVVEKIVGRIVPRRGVLRRQTVIQPFVPTIMRRGFIDPGNIALVQQGLHESVTLPGWTGTSYYVKDPRIDAAGKTGTAESNKLNDPHAWWVGYAPYNNPQVAVVVMVPYAASEGAYVAAPIAHKLLEDYFHMPPITDGLVPTWLQEVQRNLVNAGGSQ